jgi:hypothetical protein
MNPLPAMTLRENFTQNAMSVKNLANSYNLIKSPFGYYRKTKCIPSALRYTLQAIYC